MFKSRTVSSEKTLYANDIFPFLTVFYLGLITQNDFYDFKIFRIDTISAFEITVYKAVVSENKESILVLSRDMDFKNSFELDKKYSLKLKLVRSHTDVFSSMSVRTVVDRTYHSVGLMIDNVTIISNPFKTYMLITD